MMKAVHFTDLIFLFFDLIWIFDAKQYIKKEGANDYYPSPRQSQPQWIIERTFLGLHLHKINYLILYSNIK